MRKPSESYLKLKKATDKILSGAGLVILSPVFAGIAIAIKLESFYALQISKYADRYST